MPIPSARQVGLRAAVRTVVGSPERERLRSWVSSPDAVRRCGWARWCALGSMLCVAVDDGRPFSVNVLLGHLFHNLTWGAWRTQGLDVSGLRAFVPQ